ncbi:MAG: protein O-mannosyl-transferase family, partial [Anaerolineae bacterium]
MVKTPTFAFRHALVVALAGALLGLFLARFWYELDPVRFAPFGDWPATIVLAAAGSIFLAAQWWLALRRLLAPDAVLPVHAPFALLLAYILWPEVDLRLAAIVVLASMGLAVAIGLRAITSPLPRLRGEVRTLHRLAPIALALIVFGLYARTLGMHVGRADTFEFQVVAPTLGVAHPTGYPLVVIIGKLFSLLPIGSTAFRVNLTSAVFASAAAVVVYALIARLSGRRLIAFIAALLFAVSGVVWSQAVIAEVYALNALIAGVVLKLLIGLVERRPHPLAPSPEAGSIVSG